MRFNENMGTKLPRVQNIFKKVIDKIDELIND